LDFRRWTKFPPSFLQPRTGQNDSSLSIVQIKALSRHWSFSLGFSSPSSAGFLPARRFGRSIYLITNIFLSSPLFLFPRLYGFFYPPVPSEMTLVPLPSLPPDIDFQLNGRPNAFDVNETCVPYFPLSEILFSEKIRFPPQQPSVYSGRCETAVGLGRASPFFFFFPNGVLPACGAHSSRYTISFVCIAPRWQSSSLRPPLTSPRRRLFFYSSKTIKCLNTRLVFVFPFV